MEKRLTIWEQMAREDCDEAKRSNIRIIGVPEGQEENSDEEETVKDLISTMFPELKKTCDHIQEA